LTWTDVKTVAENLEASPTMPSDNPITDPAPSL